MDVSKDNLVVYIFKERDLCIITSYLLYMLNFQNISAYVYTG